MLNNTICFALEFQSFEYYCIWTLDFWSNTNRQKKTSCRKYCFKDSLSILAFLSLHFASLPSVIIRLIMTCLKKPLKVKVVLRAIMQFWRMLFSALLFDTKFYCVLIICLYINTYTHVSHAMKYISLKEPPSNYV